MPIRVSFQKSRGFLMTWLLSLFFISMKGSSGEPHYYELKIYHFKTQVQEARIDKYLEKAFIPGVHHAGLENIGVFKPVEQDTDRRNYVLISFKLRNTLDDLEVQLSRDSLYSREGADYINAAFNDYPYTRIETILVRSFPPDLVLMVPILVSDRTDRIYELRSYENPTEKAALSKMKMMNEGGEIDLFKKLGFNPVFFGEVVAGNRMPNLMYMTSFNNKADRDKHWDAFAKNPDWKLLVSKAEYQHNLNNASILFLRPTAYSDY